MNILRKFESLKGFLLLGITLFSFIGFGQLESAKDTELYEEIQKFQTEQDEHYINKKTSPLPRKERRKFKGHNFFTIDLSYVVEAKFNRIAEEDTVELMSSSGNIKYYRPYAILTFKIGGVECELMAYQSMRLREIKEYENYLLLPFRDATSGSSSYGGGRYLDIEIPSANTITLNFNLAYNPYCAYTSGYNCTVPPKENTLGVAIKAGLKAPADH
ncbi:MAG: hypothetical protein ACI8ZM_004509 [Crocinitomix sp.]|jgi:uncharacterized protein (DUF1684 family)